MKTVKIFMATILLLLVVFAIAIAAFIFFMDPNQLKPAVIAEVKKQTGYQLNIEGRLSWSLYPLLGVKVEHMTLTPPDSSTVLADLRGVTMAMEFKQLMHGTQKLKGELNIDDVRLAKLHAQSAHIGIDWQQETLTLAPITAALYNGKLKGIAHGAHLSATPQWDWDMTATDVQVKPFLQDMNSANSKLKLTGLGDVAFKAVSQGKTKNAFLMNLNGSGNFAVKNGSVEGMDVNYLIQSADSLLSKAIITAPDNIHLTQFDNLTGSFTVAHGAIKFPDLQLVSTAFTIKGDGNVNLAAQNLDFQLDVSPLKALALKGSIPLVIQGDLQSPSIGLNMNAVNAMITKEQINKAKAKIQEHVKGLSDKADKFLQKFLGQ